MKSHKIALLFSISVILLFPETLMAQIDCHIENSVIPPRGCKFPEGVQDPTSPPKKLVGGGGTYKIAIDEKIFTIFTPSNMEDDQSPMYVPKLSTRNREATDWLRARGNYNVEVFGIGWSFFTLGIPFLSHKGGATITAKVFVEPAPEFRTNLQEIYLDRGDFSKPEELFAYLERNRGDRNQSTPVEEVIINGRKWYHYFWNTLGYPNDLREVYVTGLAPDRYLKVLIRQHPVPFIPSRYTTYPTEDQMPGWMKQTHKFKEQVIHSLRISRAEGSKEADLYEVDIAEEHLPESN